MKHQSVVFSAVLALGCSAFGGATPEPSPPPPSPSPDLMQRVEKLEQTIARLKARDAPRRLPQRRAEEIRALVADVLADADTRAVLLDGGLTAGWEKGFFVQSPDGNFRLEFSGRIQVRLTYNHQSNAPDDGDRWGFENRRVFLEFGGHLFDPRWTWQVTGRFPRSGGGFRMRTATITRDLGHDWSVTAGQFTLPFLRERLVSSKRQLTCDRSLIHQAFDISRSQGLQLAYDAESFRLTAAFHDGLDRGGTSWDVEDTDWALTGRAELLLLGAWKQFKDFTSFRGDEPAVMIGAALHAQRDEAGTGLGAGTDIGNNDEADLVTWTVDAAYETDGLNLFAAVVGRHNQQDQVEDNDVYGVIAQGGIFVTDKSELFAQYVWGDDDTDAPNLSVFTVGVNRYFHQHDVKWTLDFGYAFNGVADAWASSAVGWREDAPGQNGQTVLRSQLQLAF